MEVTVKANKEQELTKVAVGKQSKPLKEEGRWQKEEVTSSFEIAMQQV